MNRRQFLTGVSAAAVASVLPAQAVTATFTSYGSGPPFDIEDWRAAARCCNIVYLTPDWRAFCATGEELG